jgi:hypothetical protein
VIEDLARSLAHHVPAVEADLTAPDRLAVQASLHFVLMFLAAFAAVLVIVAILYPIMELLFALSRWLEPRIGSCIAHTRPCCCISPWWSP